MPIPPRALCPGCKTLSLLLFLPAYLLPFLSDLCISDVTAIEEDIPDKDRTGKMINWDQKMKLYHTITSFLAHQPANTAYLKNWRNNGQLSSLLFKNFAHKPLQELQKLADSLEPS